MLSSNYGERLAKVQKYNRYIQIHISAFIVLHLLLCLCYQLKLSFFIFFFAK